MGQLVPVSSDKRPLKRTEVVVKVHSSVTVRTERQTGRHDRPTRPAVKKSRSINRQSDFRGP